MPPAPIGARITYGLKRAPLASEIASSGYQEMSADLGDVSLTYPDLTVL
jgi:hypothetical protein